MRTIKIRTENDTCNVLSIKFDGALLAVCESSEDESRQNKANTLCDEWAKKCSDKCREDKRGYVFSGLMLDILIKTFCEVEGKLEEAYKDRTQPAPQKKFDVENMLKTTSQQHFQVYENMSDEEQKILRNYVHLGIALAMKHMESKEKNRKNKAKGVIKVDYNYSLDILSLGDRDSNAVKIMKNDNFLSEMSSFAEETMLNKGIRSDQTKAIVNESGESRFHKGYCTVSSLIFLFAASSVFLFAGGGNEWKNRCLDRNLKMPGIRTEIQVNERALNAFVLRPQIQSAQERLDKPRRNLLLDTLRENIDVSDDVLRHSMQSPLDKNVASIFAKTDIETLLNRGSGLEVSDSELFNLFQ